MALDQNALMLAALQQRQQHPISPQAYSAAVQPPPAPAQVAGQVLPMTPHTNLPASELYDRLLQAPSGVQQLNRMQSIPPNVVPIPTEATQRMRRVFGAVAAAAGRPEGALSLEARQQRPSTERRIRDPDRSAHAAAARR